MKRPALLFALALTAAATFALGGCSTVDSRIQEKSAAFAALDAPTQEKIRRGTVELGYSTDLVYIALGQPDELKRKKTARGDEETWIYYNYTREWAGQVLTHYRRVVAYDPSTQRYYVYHEPVYTDVFHKNEEEHIRIIFVAGQVSAIEQTQPPGAPRAPTNAK